MSADLLMLAKKIIAKLKSRDLAHQPVPSPRVKCLRKLGRNERREEGREYFYLSSSSKDSGAEIRWERGREGK